MTTIESYSSFSSFGSLIDHYGVEIFCRAFMSSDSTLKYYVNKFPDFYKYSQYGQLASMANTCGWSGVTANSIVSWFKDHNTAGKLLARMLVEKFPGYKNYTDFISLYFAEELLREKNRKNPENMQPQGEDIEPDGMITSYMAECIPYVKLIAHQQGKLFNSSAATRNLKSWYAEIAKFVVPLIIDQLTEKRGDDGSQLLALLKQNKAKVYGPTLARLTHKMKSAYASLRVFKEQLPYPYEDQEDWQQYEESEKQLFSVRSAEIDFDAHLRFLTKCALSTSGFVNWLVPKMSASFQMSLGGQPSPIPFDPNKTTIDEVIAELDRMMADFQSVMLPIHSVMGFKKLPEIPRDMIWQDIWEDIKDLVVSVNFLVQQARMHHKRRIKPLQVRASLPAYTLMGWVNEVFNIIKNNWSAVMTTVSIICEVFKIPFEPDTFEDDDDVWIPSSVTQRRMVNELAKARDFITTAAKSLKDVPKEGEPSQYVWPFDGTNFNDSAFMKSEFKAFRDAEFVPFRKSLEENMKALDDDQAIIAQTLAKFKEKIFGDDDIESKALTPLFGRIEAMSKNLTETYALAMQLRFDTNGLLENVADHSRQLSGVAVNIQNAYQRISSVESRMNQQQAQPNVSGDIATLNRRFDEMASSLQQVSSLSARVTSLAMESVKRIDVDLISNEVTALKTKLAGMASVADNTEIVDALKRRVAVLENNDFASVERAIRDLRNKIGSFDIVQFQDFERKLATVDSLEPKLADVVSRVQQHTAEMQILAKALEVAVKQINAWGDSKSFSPFEPIPPVKVATVQGSPFSFSIAQNDDNAMPVVEQTADTTFEIKDTLHYYDFAEHQLGLLHPSMCVFLAGRKKHEKTAISSTVLWFTAISALPAGAGPMAKLCNNLGRIKGNLVVDVKYNLSALCGVGLALVYVETGLVDKTSMNVYDVYSHQHRVWNPACEDSVSFSFRVNSCCDTFHPGMLSDHNGTLALVQISEWMKAPEAGVNFSYSVRFSTEQQEEQKPYMIRSLPTVMPFHFFLGNLTFFPNSVNMMRKCEFNICKPHVSNRGLSYNFWQNLLGNYKYWSADVILEVVRCHSPMVAATFGITSLIHGRSESPTPESLQQVPHMEFTFAAGESRKLVRIPAHILGYMTAGDVNDMQAGAAISKAHNLVLWVMDSPSSPDNSTISLDLAIHRLANLQVHGQSSGSIPYGGRTEIPFLSLVSSTTLEGGALMVKETPAALSYQNPNLAGQFPVSFLASEAQEVSVWNHVYSWDLKKATTVPSGSATPTTVAQVFLDAYRPRELVKNTSLDLPVGVIAHTPFVRLLKSCVWMRGTILYRLVWASKEDVTNSNWKGTIKVSVHGESPISPRMFHYVSSERAGSIEFAVEVTGPIDKFYSGDNYKAFSYLASAISIEVVNTNQFVYIELYGAFADNFEVAGVGATIVGAVLATSRKSFMH